MRVKFRHPRSADPIWWRCDPSATFEQCKHAADKLLASLPPHESYSTDCFKRAHDKLLWDPRYGKRVYGQLKFKEAQCIGDVFGEGDEIICVAHLHKQWSVTCNALSETRLRVIENQRQIAADSVREDIVKQATNEHLSRSLKFKPAEYNDWKAPMPIGGGGLKPAGFGKTSLVTPYGASMKSRKMSNTMSKTISETSKRMSSKSSSKRPGSSGRSGGNGRALAAKN